MWIWGFFFFLIGSEILTFKSSDALLFKSLIKTENEPEMESNDTLPYKQVRYDKDGILCINGTFPGITEPIVVDKKAIPKHCAYKPFYVLSVCPAIKQLLINGNIACPEGIIFCYDGQLNDLYVLEQFVLPFNENEEITQKCKNMNGFKIALHYLPWMKEKRNADKDFGDFFMEIKTSYMTESYYFPLPHSNCMDLSLGNPDNLLTGVRSMENDNNLVMPVQVDLHDNLTMVGIGYRSDLNEDDPNQSIRKKFIEDFTTLPDYMRKEKYSDKPHLKMLYLDFRAQSLVPQMMRAIIPESKSTCNMMIRRGNTIQECKAEFRQKNYALRSFKNNQTITKYGLTVESGIEEWRTEGQKTTTSKGSLFSTERGGSSTDESTSLTGLQRENENVESFTHTKVDEKGETDKTNFDGSTGLGFGVKKGGFTGNIGGEYRWGWEQTNSFLERSERMNSLTTAHSFSETTSTSKSLILENAYRHTSTSIDNQQQSRIQSNTVGVTKRTVFKWLMTVPPGKVLTPMQMQMDCDGTNVKIPWIKFVLTDEEGSLPVQDYD